MRRAMFSLVGLIFACSLALVAQDVANPGSKSLQDRDLYVQTTKLSASSGTAIGHLHLPAHPLAGVVFSHSEIRYAHNTTDLLPMAKRVAEAGAAVIVVDRVLLWPDEAGRDLNRVGTDLTIAAVHWLLTHASLDSTKFAYVGPDSKAGPDTLQALHEDGIRPVWVPLGEPRNLTTTTLATPHGQAQLEDYLRRHLGLAPLQQASICSSGQSRVSACAMTVWPISLLAQETWLRRPKTTKRNNLARLPTKGVDLMI